MGVNLAQIVSFPLRFAGRLRRSLSFRHSPPRPEVSSIPLPRSPPLQKLHRLDASSPDFQDQLNNVLRGEEYVNCLPNLEDDDSAWLVDYLDKVSHRISLRHFHSSQCRPLIISILPVRPPTSVYTNSETYAARGRYSQRRT